MNFEHSPQLRLAQLLSDRAREDYRVTDPVPSALATFLVETCKLAPVQADAVAWGETSDLAAPAVDRLATVFDFERELLACVLQPSSPEMAMHALRTARSELDVGECPFCDELAAEIQEADTALHDLEDLRHVCVNVLLHTGLSPAFAVSEPGFEEELFGEPLPALPVADPLMSELAEVLSTLPPDARRRVLTYAHHEAASLDEHAAMRRLAAYGRLREHLTPLAVRVFEELAAEDAGLAREQLLDRLRLADGRSLGQIPRSVTRALRAARQHGADIEHSPLLVDEVSGHLRLDDDARAAWQELLRADRHQRNTARRP